MVVDLNKTLHKALIANAAINERLDAAVIAQARLEPPREYLGASSIGQECSRKILWDWRTPAPPSKASSQRVFWRGHTFEKYLAEQFVRAGFDLRRGDPAGQFVQADGRFRGHCDGIFRNGPEIEGVAFPCLWECKTLGKTSFNAIEKHGLKKAKYDYFIQVQIYMAYLNLNENPTIFSVINIENGEVLNLVIPFDAEEAQKASDKAVNILLADEHGETPARVSDDPEFFICRFCSFRSPCHNVASD